MVQIYKPVLTIVEPGGSEVLNLVDNETRSITVPYEATSPVGTTASWTVEFTYTTSGGGYGPYTASDAFNSPVNAPENRMYTGAGGQITVNASEAQVPNATPAMYYIAGGTIMNSDITSELEALYAPSGLPTTNLLAHIAVQESSYRQFSTITLYGVSAPWPLESGTYGQPAAGSHIGLMMIGLNNTGTPLADAFDWIQNATDGYSIFAHDASIVESYSANQQASHPGLPPMPGSDIEDSALTYYRGFNIHYWVPGTVNGALTWVQNPIDGILGSDGDTPYTYVTHVRGNTIPN